MSVERVSQLESSKPRVVDLEHFLAKALVSPMAARQPKVTSPELSEKMSIGIFVTSLVPKAASQARFQRAVFAGLQRLSASRYSFTVFTFETPKDSKNKGDINYVLIERHGRLIQTLLTWRRGAARTLAFAFKLVGLGNGRLRDILRDWMIYEPRYFKQLQDRNIRLLWNLSQHELPTRLPYIRTIWDINHRIHSVYPEYSYTRYGFDGLDSNMAYSLGRASYVIVGTEEGKRQLVSIYGVHDGKVRVIPFPTPVLECGMPEEVKKVILRDRYLFYPARLWPHKNHAVIIAALKILRDKWKIEIRCVFCGANEGNLDYLLRYAESLGVRDQVEYAGTVDESELVSLYKGAVALVYASAVGPDNLPPLEAMSLGCPVITANVPGAQEQYGDGALYFFPTKEEELAERVRELLESKGVRERLVTRGRYRAASWTVENYAEKVISILDEFAAIARCWERCDSFFS